MNEHSCERTCIEDFVRSAAFPCVAAKSACAHGNISEIVYGDLQDASKDGDILSDIERFIDAGHGQELRSFVASFTGPLNMTELQFEEAMWRRLQALHDLDFRDCAWDASVSSDPASPHFSFSLRGKAFFVIGLHPNASRQSRRFGRPALAFNLHEQFETLRAQGRYDRMRDVIRTRDTALCGSSNPVLRNFAELSEARQYSGRAVPDDWRCPFEPRRREPLP